MAEERKFTLEEKLSIIRDEISLRERTYPRLVERRVMSQTKSDYRIAVMRAVAHDYERAIAQGGLFPSKEEDDA